MKERSIVSKLFELFTTFAFIGVTTFGGGYAMLPILQREIVEKKHWATDEELMDYYAIGQCTPGIIAVNTATFIGYKYAGVIGGFVATLGVISPSILIISVITACLNNFADNTYVIHALNAVRACVCVLILDSVMKLGRKSIRDNICVIIFLAVLCLSMFTSLSPILLVVGSGIAGLLFMPRDKDNAAK